MNVGLHSSVLKFIRKMNNPDKERILKALDKLEKEPPEGDIVAMQGKDGYRLRVGNYRMLFDIEDDRIFVREIGLRGQVYKGGRKHV